MSDTVFKKVDYTLDGLLHYIDLGDIGLPDIQRPFVWKPTRVRDLFDSMFRGFPVGYLLFWANEHLEGTKAIGTEDKQHRVPRLLIVDGQQRLTSLYSVLRGQQVVNADYQKQQIQIAFRPVDGRFEVLDAAIRRDPQFIHDISEIWSRGDTSYSLVQSFLQQAGHARELDEDEVRIVSKSIDRLFDLRNYPFTALEIASSVDEEQVADIFVRINSEGVQLNQADFILTLLSVFWDQGRADLESFSRLSRTPSGSTSSPYNHHLKPDPDQLLRVSVALGFKRGRLKTVYQILRGKDLETDLFSADERDRQFTILRAAQEKVLNLTNWHEFLKCLKAAGYRSSRMISSQIGVLYSYAFFLIGRHEFGVEPAVLRRTIARWFFMTSLTGRYSSSPESTMDTDLARLRGLRSSDEFCEALERVMADVLTHDFWEIALPNSLATSAARNPSLFAYYAALDVLNAPVLFSDLHVPKLLDPTEQADRSSLERHHLFPVAYLRANGVTETRDVNQAANFALLEWGDNGDIADEAPSVYWQRLASRVTAEASRLHALPAGWETMDYQKFLETRRRLMAQIVREAYFALSSRHEAPIA